MLSRLKKCGSNPTPSRRSTISSPPITIRGRTTAVRKRNNHLRRGESGVAGTTTEPEGRPAFGGRCPFLRLRSRFMLHYLYVVRQDAMRDKAKPPAIWSPFRGSPGFQQKGRAVALAALIKYTLNQPVLRICHPEEPGTRSDHVCCRIAAGDGLPIDTRAAEGRAGFQMAAGRRPGDNHIAAREADR